MGRSKQDVMFFSFTIVLNLIYTQLISSNLFYL